MAGVRVGAWANCESAVQGRCAGSASTWSKFDPLEGGEPGLGLEELWCRVGSLVDFDLVEIRLGRGAPGRGSPGGGAPWGDGLQRPGAPKLGGRVP